MRGLIVAFDDRRGYRPAPFMPSSLAAFRLRTFGSERNRPHGLSWRKRGLNPAFPPFFSILF
jgi:hypothetical protein